jgi:hypothetical protein
MAIEQPFPSAPFTWPMARAAGITRRRLDEAIRCRMLRRVLRGVFVVATAPDTPLVRAQAARLVISPHAVVVDRTAAWLLGAEVFRYRDLDVLPPLDAVVLRGHEPTERPECSGGTRDLLPEDWMDLHGLRVTTPARTAMDLACVLPRREAFAAMVAVMRACGIERADVQALVPRYFRRRGIVQGRELVALADPRIESSGEAWTFLTIADHHLQLPTPQYWVVIDGVATYRLDFAYPHARVAVEYDGEEFHSGTEAREHDRVRREWLRCHGWTVIVLTKNSFTDAAVDGWLRDLRSALGLH